VKELQCQVDFLLSYIGITDVNGISESAERAGQSESLGKPSHNNNSKTFAKVTAGGKTVPSAASVQAVPLGVRLRDAVMAAVYTDLNCKSRCARNIVITSLPTNVSSTDAELTTRLSC
jgi:hypothetical protein